MASEEEKKQRDDGKGFAGLSSMVSDVDATVSNTPKQQQREASSSSTQQSSPAARPERQEKQPGATQQTSQAPSQPSGSSSAGKWLFGIAAVIGLIWLANQSDNNSSSRSTYSPAPSSTSVAPTPAWQPPAAQPQAPSRPVEDQPSIGRNNVLSTAQIRYCLAEKIRLDAAESVINNYVESDVDRFNGYVNDYNSRCGEFRYRQGALESARRDVEPYRSQLQAEGRSRFVRSPSAAARSPTPAQTPQVVRPLPDATVQSIQRRLNELGYDAGAADGLFGDRTRSAILSFQRDQGISQDGQPTGELLTRITAFQSQNAGLSAPQVPRQPSTTSGRLTAMSSISAAERSAIENVCGFYQRTEGPAAYQRCLTTQLERLSRQGSKPDLSRASASEQRAIENVCGFYERTEGPASYYNCLTKQLAQLSGRGGKPDLSRVSQSERQAIENVCGFYERTEGPASYYNCLGKQLSQLAGHGGKPDLSRVPQVERQSMENVCGFYQRTEGPASYYACLSKQLAQLGYR